mmetsp:Transcript_44012/g.42595  ORF Transcript_44012/g.42595 Transcript_44012/m.42595 type:complete len:374 (+) Transcript_44012:1110-2231(+)
MEVSVLAFEYFVDEGDVGFAEVGVGEEEEEGGVEEGHDEDGDLDGPALGGLFVLADEGDDLDHHDLQDRVHHVDRQRHPQLERRGVVVVPEPLPADLPFQRAVVHVRKLLVPNPKPINLCLILAVATELHGDFDEGHLGGVRVVEVQPASHGPVVHVVVGVLLDERVALDFYVLLVELFPLVPQVNHDGEGEEEHEEHADKGYEGPHQRFSLCDCSVLPDHIGGFRRFYYSGDLSEDINLEAFGIDGECSLVAFLIFHGDEAADGGLDLLEVLVFGGVKGLIDFLEALPVIVLDAGASLDELLDQLPIVKAEVDVHHIEGKQVVIEAHRRDLCQELREVFGELHLQGESERLARELIVVSEVGQHGRGDAHLH